MSPAIKARKESPLTVSQLANFFSKYVDPKFDELREEIGDIRRDIAEINARQEDLYKKQEDLHIEYTVIKEQLSRIEAKLDLEFQERKLLGKDLVTLKDQVLGLQRRIQDIEGRLANSS